MDKDHIPNMKEIRNNISYIMENEQLMENPISDTLSSIKNSVGRGVTNTKAALGSKKSQGEVRRNDLSKKMLDSWYRWLGATSSEGDIDDLYEYLIKRVGFSEQEADELISSSFGDTIINQNRTNNQPQVDQNNTPNDQQPSDTTKSQDDSTQPQNAQTTNDSNTDTNNSTANDNDGNTRNSGTANDNTKPRYTEENPPDNTPEEKNILKISSTIEKMMNAKATGGDPKKANFSKMLKDSNTLYNQIKSPSGNVNDLTRLYAAKVIYDVYTSIITHFENKMDNDLYNNIVRASEKTNIFIHDLRDKIKNNNSTNESINEDLNIGEKIPRSEIINFFNQAASYAIKNNLVGTKRNRNAYGIATSNYNNSGGGYPSSNNRGNGKNYVPQSEDEKDEKRFTRRLDKTWDRAEAAGMTTNDIQDAKSLALDNKFDKITNKADIEKLAAIGWAFLRSLR